MSHNALFRPAAGDDLGRALRYTVDEPIGWVDADAYAAGLASGHYRPDRTWVAEDSGQFLARAVWWGQPGAGHPQALDCLSAAGPSAGRAALAAGMLDAAHAAFRAGGMTCLPAYHIHLRNAWRDHPGTVAALAWRREAAARAGLSSVLERLRQEWTPDAGVPAQSKRLTFRLEPDDEVFLEAFRLVARGSLDHCTAAGVRAVGADLAARQELARYLDMPGRRDWWRLAYTRGGQLAGLAIPSSSSEGHVVGYLGVVPELRGRGLVDDLLAEVTRLLAAGGARRIRADTDVANRPMAAAFRRAGYRNFATRLVLSAAMPAPGRP